MELTNIGINAKVASKKLAKLTSLEKNNILKSCGKNLIKYNFEIISANENDIKIAKENKIKPSMIDRLSLNEKRIENMANGLIEIANLQDPLNEYISGEVLENGLKIYKKRVPMGVIGIIYESRPNVTSDAFGICLKASSAVILRGGKEAINSNKAIVSIFKKTLKELDLDENIVQLIENTQRETSIKMMKMHQYIDLLIPRGGAGLIKTVIENSTVPVIETGTGNCHIFVDEFADIKKAIKIIINAKVQRPSVCNSLETLIIHKNIAENILPELVNCLKNQNVEIRVDKPALDIIKDDNIILATENDWETEYLDYILAIKIVNNLDEALEHIFKYSTGHSEAIITESYENANKFTEDVNSAVVYVNASTRFTDGEQFGFGAEIGISTQKLHARGPMGIKEITSYKYIVLGNGQIRD